MHHRTRLSGRRRLRADRPCDRSASGHVGTHARSPNRVQHGIGGYGSSEGPRSPLGEVGARCGRPHGSGQVRGPERAQRRSTTAHVDAHLRQADGAVRQQHDEAVALERSTASRSSSSGCVGAGVAATSRSVSARRWRNEPSNGLCLRSGSSRVPREGQSLGERAHVAARNACEADRRAEIHQRLSRGAGERVARCAARPDRR